MCAHNRYYVGTLLIIRGKELAFTKSLLCTRYFIHKISFSPSSKYYFHFGEKETEAQKG